jgi:hypothetical protein
MWQFADAEKATASPPVLHIGTTASGRPLDALIGAPCPSAFGLWLRQLKTLDLQVAQIEPTQVSSIEQAIARHHATATTTSPASKTGCDLSFTTSVLLGDANVTRALATLPELGSFERLSPGQRTKHVASLLAEGNRPEDRALVHDCFAELESRRELHLMHAKISHRWRGRPGNR